MISLPSFSDLLSSMKLGDSSTLNGGSLAPYSPPGNANDIVWKSNGGSGTNILGSLLGGVGKGLEKDSNSPLPQMEKASASSEDVGSQEQLPLAHSSISPSDTSPPSSFHRSSSGISHIMQNILSSGEGMNDSSLRDILALGRTGAANTLLPPENRRSGSMIEFTPQGIAIGGKLITGSGDSFRGVN